jgi:hypothetical protein
MKMSLEDLKSMYKPVMPNLPGNPNLHTRATKKHHIHVVNPSAKPSKGLSSHAQARKARWASAEYLGISPSDMDL